MIYCKTIRFVPYKSRLEEVLESSLLWYDTSKWVSQLWKNIFLLSLRLAKFQVNDEWRKLGLIEHLEAVNGKILFTTLRNLNNYENAYLKLIDLDSEEMGKANIDSGYGHYYKKYSFVEFNDNMYFCTRAL